MKVYAVNGSPRTTWNTAQLCQAFLEGIKAYRPDIEVEMIHLSKINFRGCMSCYACKRDDDKLYGTCQYKDGVTELLKEISKADGILMASPIYFGEVSSLMRAFMERLFYPWNTYEENWKHISPKRLKCAVIYNMTVKEEQCKKSNYAAILDYYEKCIARFFQKPEHLYVYDTCQFKDYSKYRVSGYNVEEKIRNHKELFPQDLKKAYNMGYAMAEALEEK